MSAAVTGAAARAAMLARLRDAGVEGPVLAAGDTAQAGVAMVAAGLGVFACPLSTARSTPADVATVPIEGWTTTVDMVWRPGPLEPAVRAFLDNAREVCRSLQPAVA
jgi:DNA-binding transcriptional LysR family regulator